VDLEPFRSAFDTPDDEGVTVETENWTWLHAVLLLLMVSLVGLFVYVITSSTAYSRLVFAPEGAGWVSVTWRALTVGAVAAVVAAFSSVLLADSARWLVASALVGVIAAAGVMFSNWAARR
jgi:hypothetical protein